MGDTASDQTHALSDVLDAFMASLDGESVKVKHAVDKLGCASFASVTLIISLISTNPARVIPGSRLWLRSRFCLRSFR